MFLLSATIIVFCMLIASHKSPVVRDSAAQTADDKLVVRAPGYRSSARLPLGGVCDPVGSQMVVERGFPQALPL